MVTFKGEQINLLKETLDEGQSAPDFELVEKDLKRISLSAFEGQVKILHCVPSFDTMVCAQSFKNLHTRLGDQPDISLLHISKDLPFAQERFCQANKAKATFLSAFDSTFAQDYGLLIATGPLKGLLARCLYVLDAQNKILYKELVSEITQEPNYGALMEKLTEIF